MKASFKVAVVILLNLILILAFMTIANRYLGNDPDVPEDSIIKEKDIYYKDGIIYLDIIFKQPISCKLAMDVMEFDNLEVKGKTFIPSCSQIDDDHIRISYESKGISI